MATVVKAQAVAGVDLVRLERDMRAWYDAPYNTKEERAERDRLRDRYLEAEKVALDAVERHCTEWFRAFRRGLNPSIVGMTFRRYVGDGHALYVVLNEKPFTLGWIDIGDCYRCDPIWERGLRLSDVKNMLERAAEMDRAFSGPEAKHGEEDHSRADGG